MISSANQLYRALNYFVDQNLANILQQLRKTYCSNTQLFLLFVKCAYIKIKINLKYDGCKRKILLPVLSSSVSFSCGPVFDCPLDSKFLLYCNTHNDEGLKCLTRHQVKFRTKNTRQIKFFFFSKNFSVFEYIFQ